MRDDHSHRGRPVRVGSLFSGYGGLDLAVEYATGGETIWFSEINTPSIRVFAHHWPGIPNLGDITSVDWAAVPPVDILIGGFPLPRRLDRRQGRRPRTRHPLRALAAHGGRDRRTATRARRHRERPRPTLRTRNPRSGRRNPRCTQPRRCNQRACNRRSQPGTRPVAAGRRANATSSGARSRTRGSGRPPEKCTMDRLTGVTGRRTASPVPGLHHRLPRKRCSGRLWPRTPRAAARPWTRYGHGGARSP